MRLAGHVARTVTQLYFYIKFWSESPKGRPVTGSCEHGSEL